MAFFSFITRRPRYQQRFVLVLVIVYFIASAAIYLKYNRGFSKGIEAFFEQGSHLKNKYLWTYTDFCSSKNLEIMGVHNYVCKWFNERVSDSTGHYVMYGKEFASLTDVTIDPTQGEGHAGGENMTLVMNQASETEVYSPHKNYFNLQCTKLPDVSFNDRNHLNDWVKSVTCTSQPMKIENVIPGFTIAIRRYEYVNLYHTMTDYYNAFLMMVLFRKAHTDINILFVDGHPQGGLDLTWNILFKKTYRAGALQSKTTFPYLIWNIMGYNSPLDSHELPFVPYLDQFREFFLVQHGANVAKTLNCDKLSVLIIWRRDYVAHPRNPTGRVTRKFKNEDEILSKIRELLPDHDVKGLQLDKLSMTEQLQLISQTDILVGMHGAGLAHTLFLPKHAGLVEFYPTYWSESNRHFRAMATWRELHYLTWKNHDTSNEYADKMTYIPPHTLGLMMKEMLEKLCKSKQF